MFSSTNPFLHFTNDHDIFLHPQDPLLSTTHNFSFPADAPVATTALINYHMGASNHKKPTLKKDRHSKIRTAQGLRDRRVRLSIGIARKFFDLQDTLGFDKASETLEWLLTKSETSIMELTHRSGGQGGGNKISFSSTSECEVLSTTDEEVVNINGGSTTNKLRKAAIHNDLSKELRVKARERARARTREKLCTRRTNPHTLLGNCDQSVVAQVEELPSCHSLPNRVSRADIIEESIVIKRMLKPPASNFAYHQNFVTAKDVSSIMSNNYLPSLLPQTWDFSGSLTCSSFYAMLNTNLSSEFQVHGKPWEAQNNNQSLQ